MPTRDATHDGKANNLSMSDRIKKFNRLQKEHRGEEVRWTEKNIDLGESGTPQYFDGQFNNFCKILDRNVDDVLDLTEFRSYYPDATKIFFSKIDTQNNSRINKDKLQQLFKLPDGSNDLDRLLKFSARIRNSMMKEFQQAFDQLCDIVDENGDNVISLEEFQMVNPDATQHFFAELDLNNDDFLSKLEFMHMFELPSGSFDLPFVKEVTDIVLDRISAEFQEKFNAFLSLFGVKGNDKVLELTDFKNDFPEAYSDLFENLRLEPTSSVKIASLKRQFVRMNGAMDLGQLQFIHSHIVSKMGEDEPLDIAIGWNSISQPFALYEQESLQSKKIYSGVRGEEIYITDVGSLWVTVSSPMPGYVRITSDDLRYVSQVKQYVSDALENDGLSEGLFHSKPERQPTVKSEVCVTKDDSEFKFPHDEKFEIEFGWFQTLPFGLKIWNESKDSTLYTLVAGEELHVVERKGAWVKLDSPMEGYLKITNDENRIVIKIIRNFITSMTEKLTKKAVDKHEKIAETRIERKKQKEKSLRPKWKGLQTGVVVTPEINSQNSMKVSIGGEELPSAFSLRSEQGTRSFSKSDAKDFITIVGEMADNRKEIQKLKSALKELQKKQSQLQESMLDKFDQAKDRANSRNMSMEDFDSTLQDLVSDAVAGAGETKAQTSAWNLPDAMEDWTTAQALLWWRTCLPPACHQYIPVIKECGLTGADFLELDWAMLQQLRVKKIHAMKILKMIKERVQSTNPNTLMGTEVQRAVKTLEKLEVDPTLIHGLKSDIVAKADGLKAAERSAEQDEIRAVIMTLSSEIKSTDDVLSQKYRLATSKDRSAVELSTFEIEEGSLPKGFY